MKVRLRKCGFSIEPETQFEVDYLTDEYWNVGKVKLTGLLALDKEKQEALSLQIYDEEQLIEENKVFTHELVDRAVKLKSKLKSKIKKKKRR